MGGAMPERVRSPEISLVGAPFKGFLAASESELFAVFPLSLWEKTRITPQNTEKTVFFCYSQYIKGKSIDSFESEDVNRLSHGDDEEW